MYNSYTTRPLRIRYVEVICNAEVMSLPDHGVTHDLIYDYIFNYKIINSLFKLRNYQTYYRPYLIYINFFA